MHLARANATILNFGSKHRLLPKYLKNMTNKLNFKSVINKTVEACKNSGYQPNDHIVEFNDMILVGKGVERPEEKPKDTRPHGKYRIGS